MKKNCSYRWGDGWTCYLNLLLMPKFIEDGWEVHYIGDKHGIEHQEILKSGLMLLSILLRLGSCVAISLGKICWMSSKLVGELSNPLYHVTTASTGPFFQRGFVSVPPVIAARVRGACLYSRIGSVYGLSQ